MLRRSSRSSARISARGICSPARSTICAGTLAGSSSATWRVSSRRAAELAPLSRTVAEVRSLVVAEDFRRVGLAARLVAHLRDRAKAAGFETLCAFTHDARFFVRQNFSIVPHLSVPEKIATDCVGCPLFRTCGQYAMILPLRAVAKYRVATSPARREAVVA